MSSLSDASVEYERALKLGLKEGEELPSLDEILEEKGEQIMGEIPLGLVQIPMELLVGSRNDGRTGAMSKGFYPLLGGSTEFGIKWKNLYVAHLEEGIREPIKAYEYTNQFYVQEGNKRVSVLKYCGAVSVPGMVTRLLPKRTEEPENVIYYEFVDFYALSGINYIYFTKTGSFARLQELVGKKPGEAWDENDKLDFSSAYTNFATEYKGVAQKNMPTSVGDAFLYFIGIYDYSTLLDMSSAQLQEKIKLVWEEFFLLDDKHALELQMTPTQENKKTLTKMLSSLIPTGATKEKVAFIHQKSAENSGWSLGHELGRHHVEEVFGDAISTVSYTGANAENVYDMMLQAIQDGCTIIFTTSPPLLKGTLKAAIEHPEIKILNCSLNSAHQHIRTYYARMYEAKFLMGAIAGAMAADDKIGYVADYPIYGMMANINAFAMGAKMVNPRAKIYLAWSTKKGQDLQKFFYEEQVGIISGSDLLPADAQNRRFGLYHFEDGNLNSLAMPVWNWGKFYEIMIQNILNGTWKFDDASSDSKGLNYWWGMSSEIIDVICSKHLPIGTGRLAELLKQTICRGDFNPFTGILYSQNGVVQNDPDRVMPPEEIIRMDWLADNVIGTIPSVEELIDEAKAVVEKSGLENPNVDATTV